MANSRRRLIGRVVSDKMDKTIVVAIERRKMHRVYKKVVRTTKKVMAHDESNNVEVGSLVQVVESKPISKNKRWVVEKVLETPGGRVLEPIVGEVDLTPEAPPAEEVTAAAPVEDAPAQADGEEMAHDSE
jgi:small subunit ribosomal protein S17